MHPVNRSTRELIEAGTAGISSGALEWAPEGKWSSAQVLEHLAKAYGGAAKLMESTLANGKLPEMRPLTLKDRVVHFVVLGIEYFPGGRKAPAMVVPAEQVDGAEALQRALQNIDRFDEAVQKMEDRWGSKNAVLPHPILGPLTTPQWRTFHFVHTRHHMKQVRERGAKGMEQLTHAAAD